MKSLRELCHVRETVFDRSKRDTVLDLTDLLENKINPDEFFTENYLTEGMISLLRESFRRFQGISTQGVFILSQAMGGGKTHNMICLGLLAKYPHLRSGVGVDIPFESDVRVVGFTGREMGVTNLKPVVFSTDDTQIPIFTVHIIASQLRSLFVMCC